MSVTKKTPKADNANIEAAAEKVAEITKAVEVEATKAIEKAIETATTTSAAFKTSYDEAVVASKQSTDAFMQSGETVFKGMQDMHSMWMSFMSAAVDKNTQAMQTVMGSKSIEAVVEANTKIAEDNYNDFVAHSEKVRDLSTKIAEKAADPISTEFTACQDRLTKAMAA